MYRSQDDQGLLDISTISPGEFCVDKSLADGFEVPAVATRATDHFNARLLSEETRREVITVNSEICPQPLVLGAEIVPFLGYVRPDFVDLGAEFVALKLDAPRRV
jgi:hypothetical protein